MNELALFAGAGGGILGGYLLGWRTVCAVEIEDYPRRVLLARQRDGILPRFPIWDDIKTFDGTEWRGRVDVVSGGFPCQDISAAGKGAGLAGSRSGLWAEMARVIGEVQPACVWVENSPMLVIRGLDRVLWDLAALGYDARWGVVSAGHAGAPHKRERCWILAYAKGVGLQGGCERQRRVCEADGGGWIPGCAAVLDQAQMAGTAWSDESGLCGLADGVADRVERTRAIGNGQVPAVVRLAWETLMPCTANRENDMSNSERRIK